MTLSFAATKKALLACVRSKVTPLLMGPPGCIAGDMHVPYTTYSHEGRRQNHKGGSLERLYRRFNRLPPSGRDRYDPETEGSRYFVASMNEDGKILQHEIDAVIDSGIKQCVRVTTASGLELICTPDHPLAVEDGFTPVEQLKVGDVILTHQNVRWTRAAQDRRQVYRPEILVKHHPHASMKVVRDKVRKYANEYRRLKRARVVYEAALNGLTVDEYVARLNDGALTGLRFSNPDDDIHHRDENPTNDVPENLVAISHASHAREHMFDGDGSKLAAFIAIDDEIESIEVVGERHVYDIRMKEGDPRNFVCAGGFVVHNCGKTSLIREVAYEAELPCYELLASNCDAVDIAGLPYIDPATGELRRSLLPQIKACVDAPGILFLDELTAVPASVQAPLMRLLLERYAGGVQLHPESAVVGAANNPEECPGGVELSAASINRVCKIVDFQPQLTEIRGYFDTVGEEGSRLREEALDFAATLSVAADLIDFKPPRQSIDASLPFGSPRAWELGLRAYSDYCETQNVGYNVGKADDELGYALLSGCVGDKAAAFFGIRAIRKHLPSTDEILKNPIEARVPAQPDRQLAAVGLLARVAEVNLDCAWLYATRLTPEVAAACGRVLMNRKAPKNQPLTFVKEGKTAMVKLLAATRNAGRPITP